MKNKFVSWRRVSTKKQNSSGLGLAAQKEIIKYFIEREQGDWIADYEECYTGTDLNGCLELKKAIKFAKENDAVLIIAKTDRFRNTIEALQVYDEMGDGRIMFCDLPHTDKFTLTLFFALAEREALIVSIRTKQALDAKKARGEKVGGATREWKIKYENKTEEERNKWQMKKGETKRQRHQDSRDMAAFERVIRSTFPDATKNADPRKWDWAAINCKEPNKSRMLTQMRDHAELDESGKLFLGWDFSDCEGNNATAQKLRSYMYSFRRSYTA